MAGVKVTALAEATSISADDLIMIIDDPSGSEANKKATFTNVVASVPEATTSVKGLMSATDKTNLNIISANFNISGDEKLKFSGLSQPILDYINASGGGAITNFPDEATIDVNGSNQLQIHQDYLDKFTHLDNLNLVNVKDSGAVGDGTTDDTSAIATAMALADSVGAAGILLSSAVYNANITMAYNGLAIIGQGTCEYDEASGTFASYGTRIKGQINLNGKKNITVRDLSVDATGLSTDGIKGGTAGTSFINHTFKNLVIVGDGYSAQDHALLCESGYGVTIDNIKMYNWYHGIAVRTSYVNISNIYAFKCVANAIIIKSATGNEQAWFININNVIMNSDSTSGTQRSGTIRVQSYNTGCSTRYVNISNVTQFYGGESTVLVEQIAGTCANVNVVNANSVGGGDASVRANYDVSGATDVTFRNCIAVSATGYGFRTRDSASRIRVYSSYCYGNALGAHTTDAAYGNGFDVLELNTNLISNRQVAVNYDKDTDTIPQKIYKAASFAGGVDGLSTSIPLSIAQFRFQGNATADASLAIKILSTTNSGSHSKNYQHSISVIRTATDTIESTVQQDVALTSGAGTSGGLTITVLQVDDGFDIQAVSTSYSVALSCKIDVVADKAGYNLWEYKNLLTD